MGCIIDDYGVPWPMNQKLQECDTFDGVIKIQNRHDAVNKGNIWLVLQRINFIKGLPASVDAISCSFSWRLVLILISLMSQVREKYK